MGSKKTAFMRSALIALGVGAAVLVLVLSTTLYLVMLTQYYVGEAVLARKVRLAASDLYLALQQAETGQRGYLLTHDQSFLNSYDAAIDVIDSKTEVLADLLGQATYLNIDFGRLKAIIGRKVIELKGTVELARNGKNPDALKIVRNEYGLRLMTQARGLLDQIIGQSDQRLLLQVDRQRHFGFILKLVTGF
jgi:CHASE3 domain sensor protein